MKKTLSFLLAVLFLFSLCLLPLAATDEKLPQDPRVAQVQSAVAQTVGTDTTGGAVVLAENGSLTMLEGFGYADMGEKTLVSAETVFEIGELTGLFTALTILKLADAGKLSLDENIAAYLPADFLVELSLNYRVTLRALISGTAGFEGREFDRLFSKESHTFESLEEALLSDIPSQTLGGEDLTQYSASAFGISLAAYVAESALDTDFAQLVQEELLTPLGMTDTVLLPDKNTAPEHPALGYTANGDGTFTAAANGGRAYTGLPYATGALSTPADLSKLLSALLSPGDGVLSAAVLDTLFTPTPTSALFETSTPGFSLTCGCPALRGKTLYFSASLALDRAAGIGVLVLANTADTLLSDLPETMCGTKKAVSYNGGTDAGELPELKTFRGLYVPASGESHTFVGRYRMIDEGEKATVNKEEGTLSFLGLRLVQIGPGIFAEVTDEGAAVAVQFLFDEDGKVVGAVTASGESFIPAPFYRTQQVAKLLFFALLVFAGWFLIYGLFSILRFFAGIGREHSVGFLQSLPGFFTFFLSLFVLWQVLLCVNSGTGTLSSVYLVLSVLALIFGIGAAGAFTVAILTSLLDGKRLRHAARAAILFVLYVLLASFWGLVFF